MCHEDAAKHPLKVQYHFVFIGCSVYPNCALKPTSDCGVQALIRGSAQHLQPAASKHENVIETLSI